jgi:hypothetical protein
MSDHYHDRLEFIADELELAMATDDLDKRRDIVLEMYQEARRTAEDLRQEYFRNASDITIRDEYDGFVIILENVEGERIHRVRIDHEDSDRKALIPMFEKIDPRLCVYYEEDA